MFTLRYCEQWDEICLAGWHKAGTGLGSCKGVVSGENKEVTTAPQNCAASTVVMEKMIIMNK